MTRAGRWHRWALVAWLLLAVPGFTVWIDSVRWVNLMSWYAIVISHLAAVAAERAVAKVDEQGGH